MSEHTPGPWHLCRHLQSLEADAACPCGYRGGIFGGDEAGMVCEMGSTVIPGEEGLEAPRYPRPVELANARLIAAAPELLAACEEVYRMLGKMAHYYKGGEMAAAIKKARG